MLYPTTMAAACSNALWLPVLADTALQSLAVWAVCMLCSRYGGTLGDLIGGALGGAAARIVYALFALYFVLSAAAPMSEQQIFVHDAFYDTIPSLLVFLPFFFFSLYAGAKGLTNAGRTAEACLPLFWISVALLLIMALPECDFSNLLPVFAQSPAGVFSGCARGFFRFDGGAAMLMFMGNFKYKKGDAAKITLSCALGGAVVAFVCAVFYAIYSDLAVVQPFAISKISIFFSAIALIGRTDLLAVYVLDIAMLFSLALYIQLATYCLCVAAGREWKPAFSAAVSAVLLLLTLIFNNKSALVQALASSYMGWAALAFAYAAPALAWIIYAAGGKAHEKV